MIAILEKSEHNIDFHQIVDFIEASHIRIETTNEGTKILATVDGKPMTISKSSIRRNLNLNDEEGIISLPDAEFFENLALMGYNILPNQRFTFQKGEGLAIPTEPHHTPSPQEQQSPHYAPSSPSHPTATTKSIPTETPTETPTLRQYSRRATRIAQSKAFSPAADEHASLLRDDSQGEAFPIVSSLDAGQDRENINKTSALPHESTPRVTSFVADEGKPSGDDAPIKGRSMKIREEVGVEISTKLGSNDTEEMVNVLSSIEAVNILTSGVAGVSVLPVAGVSTVGVPTVSGLFPTVSAIFTTASVVTPYSRRPRGISAKDKGKEKVVEFEEPKKKKIQEQIDAQVAREMEEEIAREDQRMNEQLARDAEIARIHAEEELKILIDGLDRSNEYQAQQSKPFSKKEQREFYMSVLRSHAGWKTKHFRGMTLEEIKEKFIPVWKQIEDFVPMSSKEEAERVKKKGLRLAQGSSKRMKTSEDVSEEDLKGMMQLFMGYNFVPMAFLPTDMLKLRFFCQNNQFCWSQTSHTNSSDKILQACAGSVRK
nr:hypothetical protein [Tanacetum cinerariifolium]